MGQGTIAAYDYATGKPTATIDANGVSTTYAYDDPLDRVTQVRRAAGGPGGTDSHTNLVYPTPTQVVQYRSQASEWDLRSDSFYDGFGRLVEQRSYEDVSHYIATKESYDALGRVVAVAEDPHGLNYGTFYDYDALDNLTRVRQGRTSPQVRTFVYDSLGRRIRRAGPRRMPTTTPATCCRRPMRAGSASTTVTMH